MPAKVNDHPGTEQDRSADPPRQPGHRHRHRKLTTVIGRNPSPAWKAVNPSTPCISWVVKKKKPIIAPR